jgi:hypothetical protein
VEKPFVAIQINATSFMDEGIQPVLDNLQNRAGVNSLLLATPAWTRGVGGRVTPGHPIPDHGGQEYDFDWWGGNYARANAQFYGNTMLGTPPRAPEYPDFDLLGDVIPAAKARGMQSYAWIDESSYIQAVRDIPNMPKVLEVDVWNRPSTRPCFNNPDYRNWWLSVVEDFVKSYDVDGVAFCSERPGPLNTAMQGPVRPESLSCFCSFCKAKARERGINCERAQQGYLEILEWNRKINAGERPSDGAFIAFWRILLTYPEVLAWQALWTDSQHQVYRDMYGTAKASNQLVQVGWHVYHNISFSPFYRADQDYAKYAQFSDFLKIVAYNNAAGPRFHSWVQSITRSLFADFSEKEIYPVLLKLLNLDEGDYDALPQTGFSAGYVERETARAVRSAGATKIYTGIDVDIPVGVNALAVADRAKRFEGDMGGNRDATRQGIDRDTSAGEDLTACTPGGVKDAVLAAFRGGAQGVILSRKYSEMMLTNLDGAGAALKELGY